MAGRLAELWQSAPHEEKQAWSLKAKRLALKSGSSLKVKLLFAVLINLSYLEKGLRLARHNSVPL
jgi:hypothetical protein